MKIKKLGLGAAFLGLALITLSQLNLASVLASGPISGPVSGPISGPQSSPSPTPAPSFILEAETMSMESYAGGAVSDPTASNGAYLLIKANGSATGSLTTSSSTSLVTVKAQGDQCNGAPLMTVTIDGKTGSTTVSSTIWKDYSVPVNFTPGIHKIAVGFSNANYSSSCMRDLKVDSITLK